MVKKVLRSAEKFSEPFPLSPLPLYPSLISCIRSKRWGCAANRGTWKGWLLDYQGCQVYECSFVLQRFWPSTQERKSAQRGSFGPDIPTDIRPKTSVRPSKPWKNKHFGTDIPRGRPWKDFGLKNFGLILHSLSTEFRWARSLAIAIDSNR